MKKSVDLYDSHYGSVEAEVYREVRRETYSEDLGQMSWITAAECDEFCRWLGLSAGQRILEIACGSGGMTARIAETCGVSAVGIDVNQAAVLSAKNRVANERVQFEVADANQPLPFPDESFDALFCNDSINHLKDRTAMLEDWKRVLRSGGRFLYTDPIVVTGCLSNAEIAVRSSIGFFLFTPQGFNETSISASGFRLVLTADVTESVSKISQRWHDARLKRKKTLCELEGETKFEELQHFLSIVHTLASERRLSRFAFVGEKI
jgi:SAM-dependent methyltransferase